MPTRVPSRAHPGPVAALLLSLACGNDGPTDPPAQGPNPSPRVPVATRMEVSAPDSSFTALELEIGATARVFDDQGALMSGVSVSWRVSPRPK